MGKGYWLNVSYSLASFDEGSVDMLICSALGVGRASESGAGLGVRDLSFLFGTLAEATRAERRLNNAVPVPLEISIDEVIR